MPMARVNGRRVRVRTIGYETLVRGSVAAANQQDTVAAVWDWWWRYQVETANIFGLSSRRDRRFATKWVLNDAPTTAMPDATRIRIVEYYPDQKTMKRILLEETYGTLKNATRSDIDTYITPNVEANIPEGNWLRLEALAASATLDESASTFEIGILRMQRVG